MNIVYWRRAEHGFTLIEMLIVLSILLLVLSFFPPLMKVILTGQELKRESSQDVTIFFNHLAHNIRGARAIETGNEMIKIEVNDSERYLIERMPSSKQIRRQFNGAGHVLMLGNVQSFQCHSRDQIVRCEVELMTGKKVARSIIMLYPLISEEG